MQIISIGGKAIKINGKLLSVSTGYPDIDLYSPDGVVLNNKYSGTSIVDGDGFYITPAVSLDLTKYRYIKVNGAHMSGWGGIPKPSEPTVYKIAFLQNGAVHGVLYTNTLALSTDTDETQWNIDMSKYSHYQDCDAVQLLVLVSTGAITSADVVAADQLQVICSVSL